MKVKLDENLPARLATILMQLGHDADTVPQEGLSGQPDSRVWEAAQHEERFFMTQDLDFSDISKFAPGSHQGILVIRLHNPSRRTLAERITTIFESETVSEWKGCFVVATERKLRVKRP